MTKKEKKITKTVIQPEPKFLYLDDVEVSSWFYLWITWEVIENVFINWEYHYLVRTEDFDRYFKEHELELCYDEDCCEECEYDINLVVSEVLYDLLPRYKKIFTNKNRFINNHI
jgi:hypothetical protein